MKYIIVYIIMIALLCVCTFSGCATIKKQLKEVKDNKNMQKIQTGIDRIEVYTSASNERDIYHVRYPFDYYMPGERRMNLEDLSFAIEPENLDPEKEQWLIQYIENLPEPSGGDYTKISYQIFLTYYDDKGDAQYIFKRGYEDYPNKWNEFVSRYNEICGEDILTDCEQYQEITPEFLTKKYGITDEDVPEGDLTELIHNQELDITKLNSINTIDNFISAYYASINEDRLKDFRPKKLISKECTDEEYEVFIQTYLKKIGCTPEIETESDQSYFRRFDDAERRVTIYIAKTEDIDKLHTEYYEPEEEYELLLDAHMEDMIICSSFLYSKDGKYLLACDMVGTDEQLAFVETDNLTNQNMEE